MTRWLHAIERQSAHPGPSSLTAVPVFSAGGEETTAHCWLLWFRSERVQSLRWAGAPAEKPMRPDVDGLQREIQTGFDMLSYRVEALVAAISEFTGIMTGRREPSMRLA